MCVHRPSGLRIRLRPLIATMMVAACQTVLAAGGSPAPSAQEKLDAIRMSLVEATLQTPTSVKGMSWIDGSGALHELSVFKNSLKIQAVRVKGYERTSDGQVKAKTEIALRQAGGLMFWTLDSDAQGEYSLVNVIYQTAHP